VPLPSEALARGNRLQVLVEQRQDLVRLICTSADPSRHLQPLTLHQDVDIAVAEELRHHV